MALCRMKDLLSDAMINNYAVGAFNVGSMEMVIGAVRAAEKMRSPIILQVAEHRLPSSPLHLIGPIMVEAARKASVPVCVHYDHGMTPEIIRQAIGIGFTSVMFDGSHYELSENIKRTRSISDMAHEHNVDCEGEVGRVGGSEDGSEDISMSITTLDDAEMFAKLTGVDAMAIAIGNAHGNYRNKPNIQFDRLYEISQAVNIPLVLHGGSGIDDVDIRKCIHNGIRKINIATSITNQVIDGVAEMFGSQKEVKYFDYQSHVVQLVEYSVSKHIKVFMSDGRVPSPGWKEDHNGNLAI